MIFRCDQAAERVSAQLDGQLSWPGRMALWMHVAMCGACQRFRRQVLGIERLLKQPREVSIAGRLSDQKRDEIKRSLRS